MTIAPNTQGEIIHWLLVDELLVRVQSRKDFREDDAYLGLVQSIGEHGIQLPLLARRDNEQVILIDGELRLRAAIRLGLKRVPVRILESAMSASDALARQLVCNLNRKKLTIWETGEAIHQLMAISGLTQSEVARKLGMKPPAVSKALAVREELPESIRTHVLNGSIPNESAYLLSRVPDAERQAMLAAEVIAGRLTRDGLAREVAGIPTPTRAKTAGTNAPANSPTHAPPTWRISRTVVQGVMLTVWGTVNSLDALVAILERLVEQARRASAEGVPLTRFLAEVRQGLERNSTSQTGAQP